MVLLGGYGSVSTKIMAHLRQAKVQRCMYILVTFVAEMQLINTNKQLFVNMVSEQSDKSVCLRHS